MRRIKNDKKCLMKQNHFRTSHQSFPPHSASLFRTNKINAAKDSIVNTPYTRLVGSFTTKIPPPNWEHVSLFQSEWAGSTTRWRVDENPMYCSHVAFLVCSAPNRDGSCDPWASACSSLSPAFFNRAPRWVLLHSPPEIRHVIFWCGALQSTSKIPSRH